MTSATSAISLLRIWTEPAKQGFRLAAEVEQEGFGSGWAHHVQADRQAPDDSTGKPVLFATNV